MALAPVNGLVQLIYKSPVAASIEVLTGKVPIGAVAVVILVTLDRVLQPIIF